MTSTLPIRELYYLQQIRREHQRRQAQENPYEQYANDPVAYAEDVLGVALWAKQVEVAASIVGHRKTLVRASHSVGKTFISGSLVNWHYDVYNPGITLTTAPTSRQVRDLLWKEVRVQRGGRHGLLPKAPRMEDAPDHYAAGFTAADATAFQGTHEQQLGIVFDEGVGIAAEFWEGAEAMLTSGEGNWFLAIYNPTNTASAAYEAELSGDANIIVISALDHPNIDAELAGLPPPFPKAVRLSWVEGRIAEWCTPISAGDAIATDLEFPPGSGIWYRPGPLFESRVMGRWPTAAVGSVWAEAAFSAAEASEIPEPADMVAEIGCDVARFGDDNTAMHSRRGPVSLDHERHNGWDTSQTAGRLKEMARELGQRCGVDGRQVPIKIDDDGVGGGVVDQLKGWNVTPVSAGSTAFEPERYPNRRSELWFAVAERALANRLSLSGLPAEARRELRRQCMAPTWRVDAQGRRVVEPKEQTKRRLHQSPDDADAMNLAYAPAQTAFMAPAGPPVNLREVYGADRRNIIRRGMR